VQGDFLSRFELGEVGGGELGEVELRVRNTTLTRTVTVLFDTLDIYAIDLLLIIEDSKLACVQG
jgi:hypothetical protein